MSSKSVLQKALAIICALLLWQAAAMIVDMKILLVSPVDVAVRLISLIPEGDFWTTVMFSLLRIVLGFLAAFILGILLAVASGRFSIIETFLWPYVITIKSVPVASFIILSFIWLSGNQLPTFISFLMVFPIIYSNVLQGIKSTDPKLLEMATLYKVPWGKKLLYIYTANVKPYLISACSVALGMSWKSGVAAEVIGVVDGSIGGKLYEAKVHFLMGDLFAWTVVIVVVSVLFEKVFLAAIKKAFAGLEKI